LATTNSMKTRFFRALLVAIGIGKQGVKFYLELMPYKKEGENQLGFSLLIWYFLVFGSGTAQFIFFSYITTWLFKNVGYIAHHLPFLTTPIGVRALCTLGVVVAGALFYMLRERRRFVYANLELGVAVVSAHKAILKLNGSDADVAFIALLGSIYIAVRACDNYSKWYKQEFLPTITTIVRPLVLKLIKHSL
jgi:hypothetical protein